MKYFVAKPEGDDAYARASRAALHAYATEISQEDPMMSIQLHQWVRDEMHKANADS